MRFRRCSWGPRGEVTLRWYPKPRETPRPRAAGRYDGSRRSGTLSLRKSQSSAHPTPVLRKFYKSSTEQETMKKAQKATMTAADLSAIYQALDRVQAMIEFNLDGTVVSANENFLHIFGYELDEVIGKHHRIFCDPSYANSGEYAEFWKKLG
ncbi:MAG: PAS domain-containing protein, partial [Deltaproteobacteria bacterium]|nr:PAS domain-containing protein [Deltaproteobacteria bacterium]